VLLKVLFISHLQVMIALHMRCLARSTHNWRFNFIVCFLFHCVWV